MSFGLDSGGFAILIAGLAYGAHLAHMPMQWIVVGITIMFGIGILSAAKAMRSRDPAR